jgi:hypothetical protein
MAIRVTTEWLYGKRVRTECFMAMRLTTECLYCIDIHNGMTLWQWEH